MIIVNWLQPSFASWTDEREARRKKGRSTRQWRFSLRGPDKDSNCCCCSTRQSTSSSQERTTLANAKQTGAKIIFFCGSGTKEKAGICLLLFFFYFGARRRKKKDRENMSYLSPMLTFSRSNVEGAGREGRTPSIFATNTYSKHVQQQHSVKEDKYEDNYICHQLQQRVKEAGQQHIRFGNIALCSSSIFYRIIQPFASWQCKGRSGESDNEGANIKRERGVHSTKTQRYLGKKQETRNKKGPLDGSF